MAFPNFKLEKLKIDAYRDPERSLAKYVGTFTAMFNPATLEQEYNNLYNFEETIKGTTKTVPFRQVGPDKLDIELLLDGTGVGDFIVLPTTPSVDDRIEEFKKLAYDVDGTIHEPRYLRVRWGSKRWADGRLTKLVVTYDSFDRGGTALRATLAVELLVDPPKKDQKLKTGLESPDVSHTRIVRAGDTLPLLAAEVYGAATYAMAVARFNGLDHPRALEPGTELAFPPLER